MPIRGPLAHIDLSVSDPDRSIAFYHTLLTALGYARQSAADPDFSATEPRRAAWSAPLGCGPRFEIEVRPSSGTNSARRVDRYAPGLHHLAFHARDRREVDRIHQKMVAAGITVLDPPADYSGRRGYCPGYHAAFYADPDGIKVEVAYIPESNP